MATGKTISSNSRRWVEVARAGLGQPSDLHVEIKGTRLNIAFDDEEFDRHIRMDGRKRGQTPDQPVVRKGGAEPDLKGRRLHRRARAGAQLRHLIEHTPQPLGQGHAGRRRQQTGPGAVQQRCADKGLEPFQPVADRALREPQLTGRERHAAMTQRRVERDQTIKRGKGTHGEGL